MRITKEVMRLEVVTEDIICNKCGGSCLLDEVKDDFTGEVSKDFGGLIEAQVGGGYYSVHLLDMETYRFSVCEKCIADWFKMFKVLPELTQGILQYKESCNTSGSLLEEYVRRSLKHIQYSNGDEIWLREVTNSAFEHEWIVVKIITHDGDFYIYDIHGNTLDHGSFLE